MAPPGKHIISCFVQYAPYHLADGAVWDDAARERFGENVIDTIEERIPNIRDLILHKQFITPLDIENVTGLTEGNIFQGELSLEQLFFNRPVPGVVALPHAGQGPVDVRLGDAPGRRDHGRARPDRRPRAAEGRQGRTEGGVMAARPTTRRDRRRTQRPRRGRLPREGRGARSSCWSAAAWPAGSSRTASSRPACARPRSCTRSAASARPW